MATDNSILFANNLVYRMPTPSSVAVNRVLKRQFFQQRTYSDTQTMTCQWNTGTDFVDLKNSALVLKIKVFYTAGDQELSSGFGQGSGANLLRNIRIYHRSGTCYTNSQKMNMWRKIQDRYAQTPSWFETVGQLMGYNAGVSFDGGAPQGTEATVVIPLAQMHPFFDPEGGVMLPACMASGLRVEIDLEKPNTAFIADVDTPPITSYSIEDCFFQTMNVTLMDSAQASLNTVAQKSSLEYIYKDVFTSLNSHPSNNSQVNIDINKSVAFADVALAVIQDQASLTNSFADSFDTDYLDSKWDFTLGANHYPNVKIDSRPLAYQTALITYDKFKHPYKESTVTPERFAQADGIYAVNLERDTSLALSQAPVNASRSLRFELSFDNAPDESQLVTVYMTYLTSARTTLLNSKVDI
jgi:hypothetical protein